MPDFLMPSLGADMESGRLVEWKVRPGDRVERGQIVAEVETDKGIIEVESWLAGTVTELLVEPGTSVPVGAPLARLDDGQAAPPPSVPGPPAPPAPGNVKEPVAPGAPAPRAKATPSARKRAGELHVDLARVAGSGPGGAVTLQDVESAAAAPRAVAGPADDARAAMRRVVASVMSRSKREIPHYYLETQVDVSRSLDWLERVNAGRTIDERLLLAVLQLRAVARACVDVPDLNGHWIDGDFRPAQSVHVGLAITLRGGGLVAPALHDAAAKSLDALGREMIDVIRRARAGTLRGSELTDATITLTNLGDAGVEKVLGIIHPPQVALVGMGSVVSRPWVVGTAVEPRPVLTLTLSADHRASGGHAGSAFLAAVARHLAEPPAP